MQFCEDLSGLVMKWGEITGNRMMRIQIFQIEQREQKEMGNCTGFANFPDVIIS